MGIPNIELIKKLYSKTCVALEGSKDQASSIRVTNALSTSCSYIHHFHKGVYRDCTSITTDSPYVLPSDLDVLAIRT